MGVTFLFRNLNFQVFRPRALLTCNLSGEMIALITLSTLGRYDLKTMSLQTNLTLLIRGNCFKKDRH